MKLYTYFFTVIILAVFFAGCGAEIENWPVPQSGKGEEKIQVAVSILPQADFVERIGKDKVEVTVMIPPGASPATYEPTPSQLKGLSRSEIYVSVGPVPFEKTWMSRIKSANKRMKVIESAQGIEIINQDPHIWLSPSLVKIQAENICKGLISVDPDNEDFYVQNKEQFIKELDELDRYIRNTLAGKRNKKFIVFHPSWGYFARDYGLEQIPIEIEGKEPNAEDLAMLIETARAEGIKVVFAAPQFSTKSAEVIAEEIGGEVLLIDPLARDYMSNMRDIAQTFAEHLN